MSPRQTGTGALLSAVTDRSAIAEAPRGDGSGVELVEVMRRTVTLYTRPRHLGVDRVLELAAEAAPTILPGVACAAVSIVDADGRIQGRGAGALSLRLQQVQRDLAEGPTWSAARMQDRVGDLPLMWVEDTVSGSGPEGVWPRFAACARRLGVHAGVSVPLLTGHRDDAVACLDLWSTRRGAFGSDVRSVVEVYARQTVTALQHARDVADLEQALASRDVIGQAKGIVMQRHVVDAAAAWTMLLEASRAADITVPDVARWLVEDVRSADPT